MKHSRWSGRRVMPSGGGWMTANPSGGVAACLVWSKYDRQQVDVDGSTVARSDADDEAEQQLAKSATCGDVNVCRLITGERVPYRTTPYHILLAMNMLSNDKKPS